MKREKQNLIPLEQVTKHFVRDDILYVDWVASEGKKFKKVSEFGRELEDLMRKYKVVEVKARIFARL